METRWYIPEGLKLSQTKVEDRIKELHISRNRMEDITIQLTRVERAEAEKKAEEDKIRNMKYISDEMTKNWDDSIQKQQEKKRAYLHDLLHKQDDINLIKYLKVKKEQEDDKKQYVDEMRQRILTRKDFPKTVASAYLFSEVLYEREKQKELKKEIKEHHKQVAQKEYEDMVLDVENYRREEEEKKKKNREKELAYADQLMAQLTYIRKTKAEERQAKIEEELLDQERARRESDRIEVARQNKIAKGRKFAKDAMLDCLNERRIELEKEREADEEFDKVTKIIQKSSDRIRSLMKIKQKADTEARFAKGALVFDNSKQLQRDAEMKMLLEKGIAEHDAEKREKDEREAAKQARLLNERHEQQRQFLNDSKKKKQRDGEMYKFEMMNRFKIKLEEDEKIVARSKQKTDNRDLLVRNYDKDVELKGERLKKDDHELEILQAQLAKYAEEDKTYLEHADMVRKQVIENGWNTYPIDVVTANYRYKNMEEKRPQRCKNEPREKCSNKLHFNEEPGKRTHCPSNDPSFNSKQYEDHLYK